jgi:DNA polymerase/3'-5' exonuclease PolX
MTLESKAKTSSDIFHSYPYDCRNLSEYGRVTKWVPLEEAQKLVVELEFYKASNRELIDFKRQIITEVHTPLAKIAEANRILKDLIIQFDFGGSIEDQRILVKDLRKVLAFNKPKETTEKQP